MKTFKGTKGEWKMTSCKFNHFRIGSDSVPKVNGNQLRIATVFGEKAWQDKYISGMGLKEEEVRISITEAKANAKLIASAPDMLECLLMFEKFDHVETYSKEWEKLASKHLNMVEKAINKAL